MTELTSFKSLLRELQRLRVLYNGTMLAYSIAKEEYDEIVTKKEDYKKLQSPLYLDKSDAKTKISSNLWEVSGKFERQMPAYLRKVLFIQIISVLESYLINVTREIFINRRELFSEDGKIEFSLNEILGSKSITSIWGKIINKKCRQLQNQGFSEVRKFYSKNFSINFTEAPVAIGRLEYLHDCRHLLVHRLGKVDKQFEHKYNFTESQILISNAEFYQAIDEIEAFCSFVNLKAINLIEDESLSKKDRIELNPVLYVKVQNLRKRTPTIFENDYTFISEESVHSFSEIKKSLSHNDENIIEVELIGPLKVLQAYRQEIKKAEGKKEFKIEKLKVRYKNLTRMKADLIKKIIAEIPPRVNKEAINEIAEKLDVTQREVSSVVSFYLMTRKDKKLV